MGLGRRVLPLGHESHACLSRLGRSAASGAELNNQFIMVGIFYCCDSVFLQIVSSELSVDGN